MTRGLEWKAWTRRLRSRFGRGARGSVRGGDDAAGAASGGRTILQPVSIRVGWSWASPDATMARPLAAGRAGDGSAGDLPRARVSTKMRPGPRCEAARPGRPAERAEIHFDSRACIPRRDCTRRSRTVGVGAPASQERGSCAPSETHRRSLVTDNFACRGAEVARGVRRREAERFAAGAGADRVETGASAGDCRAWRGAGAHGWERAVAAPCTSRRWRRSTWIGSRARSWNRWTGGWWRTASAWGGSRPWHSRRPESRSNTPGEVILVMFNPEEYSLNKDNNFASQAIPGLELAAPAVRARQPAHARDGAVLRHHRIERTDVRDAAQQDHRPAEDRFRPARTAGAAAWPGDRCSCAVCWQRVSQKFLQFLETGEPVRARPNCHLSGIHRPGTGRPESTGRRPTSPRSTTVSGPGDTLSALASAVLPEPGAWRPIAVANGIDDPRRSKPGRS